MWLSKIVPKPSENHLQKKTAFAVQRTGYLEKDDLSRFNLNTVSMDLSLFKIRFVV